MNACEALTSAALHEYTETPETDSAYRMHARLWYLAAKARRECIASETHRVFVKYFFTQLAKAEQNRAIDWASVRKPQALGVFVCHA